MKHTLKISLCFLVGILNTGCAESIDRTLSPPSDTHWVDVEVKNPSPWTRPFPLEVLYISNTCKRHFLSMRDGTRYEKVGYNPMKIPLQQQGNSNIWRARVAMNGGGSCDWKLSEFDLGIEYIDATHLGKDLVPGTAVGATIAFDDLASQNGQFKPVIGDVNLTPKYYPYIREWNMDKKRKDLTLLGEKSFISIRVFTPQNITFEPILDEHKITRWIGIEKKTDGASPKIIYPDGSVAPDDALFPDFDKVDKMKSLVNGE